MTHSTSRRRLAALFSLAFTTIGCRAASGASATSGASDSTAALAPRVDGQRLVLSAHDPQLAALGVTPVERRDSAFATLTGRLGWDENATVRVFSPFAGRIDRVVVDVGRSVRAHDALAIIASPDFGQAQADARRAATDLDLAERTLTRQRDLLQHGIVAQRDVDAAEADVARARAEKQRASLRLSAYDQDTSSVNQEFPLRTPLSGMVVERNVTPGQEVRPDQMLASMPQLVAPLFVVTNPNHLWVLLDIAEQDVSSVRAGQRIDIHVKAWPNRVFHGTLTSVGAAIDPTSRTLKVRGVVDNPTGELKAEMLVSVDAPRPSSDLVVPVSAVILDGDTHIVFVQEKPQEFARRVVETGPASGGTIAIRRGVAPGDRVVTGSTLLLEQLFQRASRS